MKKDEPGSYKLEHTRQVLWELHRDETRVGDRIIEVRTQVRWPEVEEARNSSASIGDLVGAVLDQYQGEFLVQFEGVGAVGLLPIDGREWNFETTLEGDWPSMSLVTVAERKGA